MISDDLYSYLSAQSGITTIVSTRIYPLILPNSRTLPAITYRQEDSEYEETFSGQTTLVDTPYVLDAWGDTYAEAVTLADAIKTALNNVTGSFGSISISRCVTLSGPISVFEDSVDAYRISRTFLIRHNEG